MLEYISGVSYNFGANLTFKILCPLVALTFTPGINGSVATVSATLKFTDIDGDGLPDHVLKLPGEGKIRVKSNIMGMVGLLKTIHLAQAEPTIRRGARYELGYVRAGNTVPMPQNRWVLGSVTKFDGDASGLGEEAYTTCYSYIDGRYDRIERQFLGFNGVVTLYPDGTRLERTYLNNSPIDKGLLVTERRRDSNGINRTEVVYELPAYPDERSSRRRCAQSGGIPTAVQDRRDAI